MAEDRVGDDAPSHPPRGFALEYFPTTEGAAAGARRLVGDALRSWGVVDERRGDVELVVSELINNAVLHSRARDAEVEVEDLGDGVRIVVECAGEPPPRGLGPRAPGPTQPHGRGLAIVDAVATRWGVESNGRGVRAWCEVRVPRDERAPRTHGRGGAAVGGDVLRAFVARSQLLLRLTEALTVAHTPHDVGRAVTEVVAERLEAADVGVAVVEPGTGNAHYLDLAGLGPRAGGRSARFALDRDAPVASAARDGRATYFETRAAALARFPGLGPDLEARGVGALAHLPLLVEGRPIGALAVAWSTGRLVDADERALLRTVAGYTAAALDRTLMAAHRLEVAEAVQRALLPHHLPAGGPLRSAARYAPIETDAGVGGDWYDALALPDGTFALVVGDVAGHGITASTVMAKLRYAARAHAVLGTGPAEVLARVDRLLTWTRPGTLASMLDVRYDPARRAAVVASGGHLPPLVVEADGTARYLDVPGVLLGTGQRPVFTECLVQIPADAALVLFTDGLVEVRGRDLDAAFARLASVAGRQWAAARDVGRLADRLLVGRRASGPIQDDVCVLAVSHPASAG